MSTLGDLVEETVADLNQFTINQEKTATFKGWVRDDAENIIGVELADVSSELLNARVELTSGEIIHVSSYTLNGSVASCPPWFRGQMGTPLSDDVDEDSRATVNPTWPRYQVSRKLVEGIEAIVEDVFAVAETHLTTQPLPSNYELPDDCLTVLAVTIQEIGPSQEHWPLEQWSLDTLNTDGKVYLRVRPLGLAGRTMRVSYIKKPTIPAPSDFTFGWEETGLPASAADLPGLWAKSQLILSPEASRTQQSSVEQGERSRSLQGWSASASSRRWQELFAQRLRDERRKLLDRFPVRIHKELL